MAEQESSPAQPGPDEYLCFRPPAVDASIHAGVVEGTPPSLEAAAAATGDVDLVYLAGIEPGDALAQFSDRELEALGRFVPSLLCGEESAVLIFHHESNRLSRESRAEMQASLLRLAGEEERHEIMLRAMMRWLPDTGDRAEIRDRSRRFFFGLAASDPAVRLARIAEVDSCVSIVLGAMAGTSRVARSEVFSRIVSRIRRDESRHVKICRRHVAELGLSLEDRDLARETVRERFVKLMAPVASAFETIGLDPDDLFRRLGRETVGEP